MDEVRLILDALTTTTTLAAAAFAPLVPLLPTPAQRWRANTEPQYIEPLPIERTRHYILLGS